MSPSKKLLHISFHFYDRPKIDELEKTFDTAFDWLRYTSNCWIVYTARSPQDWYLLLKPHLHPNDHILIYKIDPNVRYGYMPKWVWEWLNKYK